ncbi:hypothetical protein, partial [Mycobacterium tuberculosis]
FSRALIVAGDNGGDGGNGGM